MWNFRRSLDLPLIYCEIDLDLSWLKGCIISEILRTATMVSNQAANPPTLVVPEMSRTGATFQINTTKVHVAVVNMSMDDNIKF